MPKISVIIPARNEPYLTKTIDDIFAKAGRDIEIFAVLEGYYPPDWAKTVSRHKGRLHTIHHGQPHGMRASINEAAANADGEWLMKSDAHCMFAPGFDVMLKNDCDSKTVMIPRRYRLNAEDWLVIEDGRPPIDYEYMTPPDAEHGGLKGKMWEERRRARMGLEIDDTWLFQGSCWFMRHSYFDFLDLMDEESYGSFWKEALEIGNKAWLSGGRVVTNKKTWYAHWHKDRRGYSLDDAENTKAIEFSRKWLNDASGWKKQTKPFSWLIDHFNPPGWEDWIRENCTSQNMPKKAPITGVSTSSAPTSIELT